MLKGSKTLGIYPLRIPDPKGLVIVAQARSLRNPWGLCLPRWRFGGGEVVQFVDNPVDEMVGGGEVLVEFICHQGVFRWGAGGAMGIRGGAVFQSQTISSSVRP